MYVSLVHFAALGFIVAALPSNDVVPVPPQLRWYVIGACALLIGVLYAADRLIARWASDTAGRAFRGVVLCLGLALLLRRLELNIAAVRFVVLFAEALSPSLEIGLRLFSFVAIALLVVWSHRRIASAFVYGTVPALVLTGIWFADDLAPDPLYDRYSTADVQRSSSEAPPVIVIVFDELSYEALLDELGSIDSARFPNFARLGGESLAFSNATANYFHTWLALPPMIDAAIGLAPDRDVVLYDQTARVERLYGSRCGELYTCRGAGYLTQKDQAGFSAHVALRAADDMIPMSWIGKATGARISRGDPFGWHTHSDHMLDELLTDISNGDLSGDVLFFHTLLPHGPYIFDRDGRVDRGARLQLSWSNPQGGSSAESIVRAYHEQIEYADVALGRILDALDRSGLYEDVTLVVTADHGMRVDGPAYDGSDPTVDSLMSRVPLFIRAPHVDHRWTDVDYQHIDFPLTLEDLAGPPARSFPPASGQEALAGAYPVSALTSARPARTKTFFVDDDEGTRFWKFEQEPGTAQWKLLGRVEHPIGDRTAEAQADAR
jgi:hypothetical protein